MRVDIACERIAVREGGVTYAIVDVDRVRLTGAAWCEEVGAVYERMIESLLLGVRRDLLPRLMASYDAQAPTEGKHYTYRPMRISYRVAWDCLPSESQGEGGEKSADGADGSEDGTDGELRVTRTVTAAEARMAPREVWSTVDRIRLRDGLFLS